ncbi:unnamed protein product [Didymodactylos carnosus]|uniref:tRNA-dihydrouridine(47) synthase [NAD(P)(+)] n=1 Tax=Didymodactylos carnosus TaxID=1234261 RepID=A0A813WKU0_9BILA|nr:unnamed protein product [Didymodactylos carnosus]CAF1198317.1 unnamed protein product [Didymodactylos carnosus]CAF3646524.1 unnamed protein product [Didymodactylos carnosus]CAF4008492.1 unnamed protein product [Didymodactylos carnosus]
MMANLSNDIDVENYQLLVETVSRPLNDPNNLNEAQRKRVEQLKTTVAVAPIKTEYLDFDHEVRISLQCMTDKDKSQLISSNDQSITEQKPKKIKGQNRNRASANFRSLGSTESRLCSFVVHNTRPCPYASKCKYTHDKQIYLKTRPKDVSSQCYLFRKYGQCPHGLLCRYGTEHIDQQTGDNLTNNELYEKMKSTYAQETKNICPIKLRQLLRKKKYNFKLATQVTDIANKVIKSTKAKIINGTEEASNTLPFSSRQLINMEDETIKTTNGHEKSEIVVDEDDYGLSNGTGDNEENISNVRELDNIVTDKPFQSTPLRTLGTITDEDMYRLKPREKKHIDFRNQLYLAPLTTVGNLPFRRICKEFGADITCCEMTMCTNLLQSQLGEIALLKRHQSENIYGVQICSSFCDVSTKCVQLLLENFDVDFIDLNCACPLDSVFKKGSGCALTRRPIDLERIVRSMSCISTVPITLKLRTGVHDNQNNAHEIIERVKQWGDHCVDLFSIHGRSREQRYTKLADWNYIDQCAKLADPIPVIGLGDIYNFQDYYQRLEQTSVTGCMIARGALIKPWLFTEIKEQRTWDISASERFEMLKRYANYGLEHHGSDQAGLNKTRRFLLEWLSFLHRYIPVGLLERVQKINERPPYYFGRNDLETLLSSTNCSDWIKITELLIGKVPDDFTFLPKHKASSYN